MIQKTYFDFQKNIERRTLMRGVGVAMAVPWLSAMQSAFGETAKIRPPRRFVAMSLGLGLLTKNLNPTNSGRDYTPSVYLKDLQDIRRKFTVISGTSHPGVSGGHRAEASLLTAAPMSGSAQSRNSISVDQLLAQHLGNETRFPSLVLSLSGSTSPSYTETGSMIPAEESPSRLFTKLFTADSPGDRTKQAQRAKEGRSIMDLIAEDTRALEKQLGPGDKRRLDAYLTSVRDLEKRLAKNEAWAHKPKPSIDAQKPIDIGDPNDFVSRQRLMSDMVRLALITDSSRFITLHLGSGNGVLPIKGVDEGYHSLSHHGLNKEKMKQLTIVESAIIAAWGDFLRDLYDADEGGGVSDKEGSVLDHTSVLLTSNLGNASSHNNLNMPVIIAGGGFQHGSHIAFSQKRNHPLPNLFVSILQQTGLPRDTFATSTGTLPGFHSA
ncbi:MAG: DUF1552 domain-containing protein [Pirellulales bacterium]